MCGSYLKVSRPSITSRIAGSRFFDPARCSALPVVYTCLIAEYSFPEYNFDHGRSMSEFV
jgi:hypothetical protein